MFRLYREFGEEKLVFDGKVFRFGTGPRKGRFALSEEYADWEGLGEAGFFEEYGLD